MSLLRDYLQQIVDEKETKIIPENIKKDVTVFGVTGTLDEETIDIPGSYRTVTPTASITKGSRFSGTKVEYSGLEITNSGTLTSDFGYTIYTSATTTSSDGRVALSLVPGSKGLLRVLKEDNTTFSYVFDISENITVEANSATPGTFIGVSKDGDYAFCGVTVLGEPGTYSTPLITKIYLLKISRNESEISVKLDTNGEFLFNSDGPENTKIRFGLITNYGITIYGKYAVRAKYFNFSEDTAVWGSRISGMERPGKSILPINAFYNVSIRYQGHYYTGGDSGYAIAHTQDNNQVYIYCYGEDASRQEVPIQLAPFKHNGNIIYSYDKLDSVSTDGQYICISKSSGCDMYYIDWSTAPFAGSVSSDFISRGGPYHFPFKIKQFDGTWAITDDGIYKITSITSATYEFVGNHSFDSVGISNYSLGYHTPKKLVSDYAGFIARWAGIKYSEGAYCSCSLEGATFRYDISPDTTGSIQENKFYGIAENDMSYTKRYDVKYTFYDVHSVTTAQPSDIMSSKTAYVNGVKITGNYVPLDTSDATARQSDIFEGKTAYVDGQKVTGTYVEIMSQEDYDSALAKAQAILGGV